ncbi:MAG TPA: lactate utilization protein [Candidatus Galloscillospira stercoripullorum]|nr:lactate utilization protein [Candidatus Galloscillospira stercoripullorum]
MADIAKLRENLERRGFATACFATAEEAVAYLDGKIDGKSVGCGGSVTVRDMGLMEKLRTHNEVLWHWDAQKPAAPADAMATEVYLTSMNGVAETGELVNIDGTGNRVASTCFGHRELYIIIGVNKIAPDYEGALWRARNIAAPKNAQRLGKKTPCAAKADKCYDCQSPERICRALTVLWEKPTCFAHAEVVIVEQELGY